MSTRRHILLVSFLIGSTFLSAQNMGKEIPFRMNIRLNTTVCHATGNKAFRNSFTGIYDVSSSFNYQIFRGFNIGIQYHHNLWKTPDNKIPGINTYAQTHHGGIRVGYDLVRSETSTAYIAVIAEQGMVMYNGLSIDAGTDLSTLQTKHRYHAIDIDAGIFFYTEGNFAIGLNVAAAFTNYRFDPYSIFLNQHNPVPYVASDLDGSLSYFNFGFNLVYSFFRSKGSNSN